eukprot:16430929-Heterocapsa_arctica.AAC.1
MLWASPCAEDFRMGGARTSPPPGPSLAPRPSLPSQEEARVESGDTLPPGSPTPIPPCPYAHLPRCPYAPIAL